MTSKSLTAPSVLPFGLPDREAKNNILLVAIRIVFSLRIGKTLSLAPTGVAHSIMPPAQAASRRGLTRHPPTQQSSTRSSPSPEIWRTTHLAPWDSWPTQGDHPSSGRAGCGHKVSSSTMGLPWAPVVVACSCRLLWRVVGGGRSGGGPAAQRRRSRGGERRAFCGESPLLRHGEGVWRRCGGRAAALRRGAEVLRQGATLPSPRRPAKKGPSQHVEQILAPRAGWAPRCRRCNRPKVIFSGSGTWRWQCWKYR